MRIHIPFVFILCVLVIFSGCDSLKSPVKESVEGYEIMQGTELTVILKTQLGSNINQRGDSFVTTLKEPFFVKKTILPKGTEIRGLVKRIVKYEKLGDRAGLLLLFDQIVLGNDKKIPFVASLDTDKGSSVIKIQGKAVKDTTIIGGSAVVGALMGRSSVGGNAGAQKGLILGTGAGVGAVILSDMKEVKLPEGTELIIKLDEALFISKK